MPRKAKPPAAAAPYKTGEATQAPSAPTGMPYGTHQTSIEGQQAAPMAGAPLAQGPPPGPGPEQILNAAQQYSHVPTPLTAPPGQMEPLSTGLASGPGGGPEVMPRAQNNLADTLEMMANTTGDPLIAQLAMRARSRNRQ